jgi:hypothetical protein
MNKRKAKVIITSAKEIDITFDLGELTEEEVLNTWSSGLWEVDSMEDIFEHAAEMIAAGMDGCNLDGLGVLSEDDGANTQYSILNEAVDTYVVSTHPVTINNTEEK